MKRFLLSLVAAGTIALSGAAAKADHYCHSGYEWGGYYPPPRVSYRPYYGHYDGCYRPHRHYDAYNGSPFGFGYSGPRTSFWFGW